MSIRLRLTLLYTAVLAVTLLAFGAAAYFNLSSSLSSEVDRSLKDRIARDLPTGGPQRNPAPNAGQGTPAGGAPQRNPASAAVGQSGPAPSGDNTQRAASSNDAAQDSAAGRARFSGFNVRLGEPDVLTQIDDGQGQAIFRSNNLNAETIPLPQHINKSGFATVSVNGTSYRVLVQPVGGDTARFLPGAGPFTVLLARSLADTDNALSRLRVIFLLGGVVCLAIAGGAGWLMARNALRPISRLTAEAQNIGRKQDFAQRVDYKGPSDEVGLLATTFNEMLDGLNAAHTRLQKTLEAQRRFVADASHELRTPLTTIRGNVDLLRLEDGFTDPDQEEALADIASEAERMSRLVNNLLALARADGGLHIPREPVETEDVIAEIGKRAQRLSETVDVRLGDVARATVMADRDYLVQLLFILVDNAIKYTSAGGSVTLTSTFSGGLLRIAVADTGVGIAPADQPRIFDRFYRADPSRHGEGTGLGLSIAAWIAHELDGRIELQSAVGKGSTFTVVLPAVASPAVSTQPDTAPLAASA